MKTIFIMLMFFVASSSFGAYSKRIICLSFSEKSNAENALKALRKYKVYKKLNLLAIKNDFTIHTTPKGKYTILVIEPITNPTLYKEVMKIAKINYRGAYGLDYDAEPKQIIEKSIEDINVTEPIVKVEKSKEIIKTTLVSEKSEEEAKPMLEAKKDMEIAKQANSQGVNEDGWFSWFYVFWLTLFIIFYIMYKKYKPIYDEY